MLTILESAYRQLRRHGEVTYPEECCGVLVGTVSGSAKLVTQAIATPNASLTPRNHYAIEPRSMIVILRDANASGQQILGFYHSHPDHPAHWSPTDLAEAHWLDCSYLITSVTDGVATATLAFRLAGISEEEKHFELEELQVLDRASECP
jgi:proteasome lid subunit RPN8/RPN11